MWRVGRDAARKARKARWTCSDLQPLGSAACSIREEVWKGRGKMIRAAKGNDSAAAKKKKVRAKWVLPLFVSCMGLLLASLLMMPMLKMAPKNVPVGLLSLDEGVAVGDTQVNVGDLMVDKLLGNEGAEESGKGDGADGDDADGAAAGASDADDASATATAETGAADSLDGSVDANSEGDDSLAFDLSLFGGEDGNGASGSSGYVTSEAVNWIVVDSEEELEELLSSGACYATLTIPADFSARMAVSMGRAALGEQLVERLPDLAEGANALDGGVAALEEGGGSLASGTVQLASGASSLEDGLGSLSSVVGAAQDGAQALSEGLAKLENGASSLEDGALSLKGGADAANQAINAALAALSSDDPDVKTALGYLAGASQAVSAVGMGAEQLAGGVSSLSEGLSSGKDGALSLSAGLDKLADGASALSSGTSQLESGASSLVDGVGALREGTGSLASGLDAAGQSLEQLPEVDDAAPAVKLVINQGKNPMVSNSLASAISSMASGSGISFETTYVNPLPEGMSMGFTHMILMMLTYLSSYATAVVLSNTFKLKRGGVRQVLASVGIQVVYAAFCALAIGFCAAFVISQATGASIALADLALFVALASFGFQMLVLGSLDLFGMAGMVVPIGLLVIGMGTAYLPTEFLPAFWQSWIYPWDPLRFMADGFRGILYMGQGFWNPSSSALLLLAAVGAVLIGLRAVLCAKPGKPAAGTTE